MGAKSPVKLKLRRPMFKCNVCNRNLLSAQALKSHQYSVHKIESPTSSSRASTRSLGKSKPVSKKLPAVVPKVANPLKNTQSPMQASDNSDDEASVLASENVSDLRKIQFECPKCNEMFPTFFKAYNHIKKTHCINSKGQKVDSSSPDLIQPLRVEMCIKCNKRVRANEMHMCCELGLMTESGFGVDYMCMGCKQKFGSIHLFDLHVSGLHSDGVESFFFPNMSEFLSWKTHMQSKTKTIYLILGKCNMKQSYRCTYLPPSETTGANTTSQLCPSSIVVQEFSKGIQVHFYKTHHGHMCPDYVCPEKYKKYLITALMKEKHEDPYGVVYDEKDLYCQFKVLLESIIVEAAKVKVNDLKLLLEKALEMTSILNNYDEDDDTYTTTMTNKTSMCEEQITKALESLKSVGIKRKANNDQTDNIDQKKKKDMTPMIVNSFSMAPKTDKAKQDPVKKAEPMKNQDPVIKQEPTKNLDPVKKQEPIKKQDPVKKQEPTKQQDPVKKQEPTKKIDPVKKQDIKKEDVNVASPRILRNTQIQSPTFNDTYKDFVDKNFKPTVDTVTKKSNVGMNKSQAKPSPLTKTHIGKGIRVRPLSKLVDSKEIEEELAKDLIDQPVSDSVKNVNTPPKDVKDLKLNSSEVSTRKIAPKENKGPKLDVKAPTEAKIDSKDTKGPVIRKEFTPKVKPKKQVMKTKMGQFKPSLSPSTTSPKKLEPERLNTSIGKIKPDIEYEVMEQENDCNILILKI